MKRTDKKPAKALYEQLRGLSCPELWDTEVSRFDAASPEERGQRVGLIRAVGVVFSEKGDAAQKAKAKTWLTGLLNDPDEKVRRYAMTALPKMGAGAGEETELLALLKNTRIEREKKFLGQALEKIGGAATLKALNSGAAGLPSFSEQKIKASVARSESPSVIRMDRSLNDLAGLRIHLRGRYGLEPFVREEVEEHIRSKGCFRIEEVRAGLVILTPVKPFTLGDLYAMRCFGRLGFPLGAAHRGNEAQTIEALAKIIASPLARRLLKTFTEGSLRYRLDFVSKGHQRGAVRQVADRAYELRPEVLNDPRSAPWVMEIESLAKDDLVELAPKLTPDPRLYYRQEDVPAASHPPLAACLARLAGKLEDAVIWDPFCGSALELVERALLGGVRSAHGTDLSPEAVEVAKANFEASNAVCATSAFHCCNFIDFERVAKVGRGSLDLVITNPPMGKRVPVPDLRWLIDQLFSVAAGMLKPGGKLVLANPLREPSRHPDLKLQFRKRVDFSGFDCHVESYIKQAPPHPPARAR